MNATPTPRAAPRRAHVLAALVLASACRAPAKPSPRSPGAPATDAGDLADFARSYRAEVEALASPPRLFLSRDQVALPAFVPLERREKAPEAFIEARMFAFDFADPMYGSCEDHLVEGDGTLCTSAVWPGAVLPPDRAARAMAILRGAPPSWTTRARISCFSPHHAVVFFDERHVPVASETVCFECGNVRLAPGPAEDAAMSDGEADFFADTCRALGVGGCPPLGQSRMPDLPPPPEAALPLAERQRALATQAFGRPTGLQPKRRPWQLSPRERRLFCAWLASGVRFSSGHLECADGRRVWAQTEGECIEAPIRPCNASLGDVAECARARFEGPCGPEPPACGRSDACGWGTSRAP